MRKPITFSKFFLPAAILSSVVVIFGVAGLVTRGFALGVDFQPGIVQEVQLAPTAFSMRWTGTGNALLDYDRNNIRIIISGAGVEGRTYAFPFAQYDTIGSLVQTMTERIEGLEITLYANENASSQWLLFSTVGSPHLRGDAAYLVHYLAPDSPEVPIAEVRTAMDALGQPAAVQNMGRPGDRHFMVRVEDREEDGVRADDINRVLEAHFGSGEVVVLRSDFVGARFARHLTDQAFLLVGLTLLLILGYAAIRFKPQFAFGAVIAIIHDGIVIVAFLVWSRMEFTTSTIAAILTILGYSINNTIVIFDRIRENLRIYPDEKFVDVLNRSLTDVLGRTIITTMTTMIAVMSLFIFTTGTMQDFALALIVGLLSGVYTTLFVSSSFVYFWDKKRKKA